VIARTAPFDHCNFTVSPDAPAELIARFTELILGMRWEDPAVRPLLELEGLRQWKLGRTTGYAALERAVDHEKFYDHTGHIIAADYRY
jgi:ABC-type phosphate/phosphonate transport system substrate-binding protein